MLLSDKIQIVQAPTGPDPCARLEKESTNARLVCYATDVATSRSVRGTC